MSSKNNGQSHITLFYLANMFEVPKPPSSLELYRYPISKPCLTVNQFVSKLNTLELIFSIKHSKTYLQNTGRKQIFKQQIGMVVVLLVKIKVRFLTFFSQFKSGVGIRAAWHGPIIFSPNRAGPFFTESRFATIALRPIPEPAARKSGYGRSGPNSRPGFKHRTNFFRTYKKYQLFI